jgi:hypothetical protein
MMRTRQLGVLAAVGAWAASAGADDKTSCSNAYVAAQTRRSEHRLLAARDQLRACARQECANFMQGQMIKDCAEWLGQVEGSIPSVVLAASDASGADLTDVTVRLDGVIVARRLDGAALDVDPGSHVFSFDAPGAPTVTDSAVVLEGTKNQVIRATLRVAATGSEGPSSLSSAPRGAHDTEASAEDAAANAGSGAGWAYLAFGAGAGGIAVGSIFGVLALQTQSSLNGACVNFRCFPSSQSDINDLHLRSWVSNIGFGVGVAGVALGIVVVATRGRVGSPRQAYVAPALTPWLGFGSTGITGTFE